MNDEISNREKALLLIMVSFTITALSWAVCLSADDFLESTSSIGIHIKFMTYMVISMFMSLLLAHIILDTFAPDKSKRNNK